MAVNTEAYRELVSSLPAQVGLVAVSKMRTAAEIHALYAEGQRDFGENYVQELLEKQPQLPPDTRWHFIGHLQSNKVKFIVPFVYLIHGVDSRKLLSEIDKQSKKIGKVSSVLLQVHIAREETKFGLDEKELEEIMNSAPAFSSVRIRGLMGMASFSDDSAVVAAEMRSLHELFTRYSSVPDFSILSMGMSGDYKIAIAEGSTLLRIGSLLFGARK